MTGMSKRDQVAVQLHINSDHGRDGELFGGPLCNCKRAADRVMSMLSKAWDEGWFAVYETINTDKRLVHNNPYEDAT